MKELFENHTSLGLLSDPSHFHSPIDVYGYSAPLLLEYLRKMILIRLVENRLAVAKRDGVVGGPVHLAAGQEAIAVGVSASLKRGDRIFGAHRSHSHVLALGSDTPALFAEILGKETGLSRGMGGSMHLWDQPKGFYGSVPIVAGTVPLAVGAGLAAKLQGSDAVAVAYLGDGAIEEGVVHESLNLARVLKTPVLFVVENNLFSSHMHISQRQPVDCTARFAIANDIPRAVVDGNDVVKVNEAADALIARSRSGEGPGFLEAVTYRWYGHVDWRDDIDVGVNRSSADLEAWRKRDPISRLTNAIILSGSYTQDAINQVYNNLNSHVEESWNKALEDPYPDSNALLNRVYCIGSYL
jgi:pyruvate dehydrogenase E1 component alpha subunit